MATSRWSPGLPGATQWYSRTSSGCVEAGDLEVPQPPQVEPAGHHRVDAAHQGVLHDAAGRVVVLRAVALGAERHVLHRTPAAGRDAHHDATDDAGERVLRQRFCDPRRDGVGRLGRAGPVQVQVDDRLGARRDGLELGADRAVEAAVGELRHLGDGGDEQCRPAVEHVVGHDDRTALGHRVGALVGLHHLHHAELVLAVVPARQHLEHRLAARVPLLQALGEEPDDPLGDRDERVDPRRPVVLVVGRRECLQLGADLRHHAGAGLVDGRLVEPAEPRAAREVSHHGVPQLGGHDEPVEDVVGLVGQRPLRRGRPQPLLQHRADDGDVGGLLLVREEQAVHRLLEDGRALEIGDAVVRQRPGELVLEHRRQLLAVDVEALQVGVEVLSRAVHALVGTVVLVLGTVAGQLGDVGERAQDGELGDQDGAVLPVAGAVAQPRDGAGGVAGRQVEAQQHPLQVAQRARAPVGRVGVGRHRQLHRDARFGLRVPTPSSSAIGSRRSSGRTGLDLATGRDVQLAHPRPARCGEHGLHLHRLEHQHAGAGLHLVTDGHRHGDDESRCGRTDHAPLVARDAVGDAVDLDRVDGAVRGGDDPVGGPGAGDAQGVAAEALDLDVDRVGTVRPQRHPVALGRDLGDGDALRLAAQREVDRSSGLVPCLRVGRRGRWRRSAGARPPPPARTPRCPPPRARSRRARARRADRWCGRGRSSRCRRSRRPPRAGSSRSSRKLLLVAPPSMTTWVSASARRSRASASSRSRP